MSQITDSHPLDRPVWNALNGGWSALARGDASALRLDQSYGPFGAAANSSVESRQALARLIPANGELWSVETEETLPPPGAAVVRTGVLHQMIATSIEPVAANFDIVTLTETEADEMRALAHLTQPGPFFARTHQLGEFVGIRRGGGLVAMAGERMKLAGFAEVSGVCTHPDYRGHGYAGVLMSVVAERMLAREETPFLHSYASNSNALALYEKLGFRLRTPITLTVLARQ